MPTVTINRDDIRKAISGALADILHVESLDLSESSAADDVEGWDSINHVRLLIALESEYKIRFNTDEVTGIDNVGQLIDLIEKKRVA